MSKFTVFCRDSGNAGSTTWIGCVEASDAVAAIRVGRDACAQDWGYYKTKTINVVGVAEGDVALDWSDFGLEIPEKTVS